MELAGPLMLDGQGGDDTAQRMFGYDPEVLLTPEKEPRRRQVGCITPEAFAVGDPAMRSHLVEEGFAVVRAAVDPAQLAVLRDSLWHFLESATGMQRGDASTWGGSFPGPSHLGMLSWAGIGQSDFMWHARTSEGVTTSFEVAWGLEPGTALLTSFDGCAFFRPPQLEPSWASQGALSWLHIDQGILKPSLCGIQGALLLYDQTISSGGLVLVPRSHRRHERILSSVARENWAEDFLPISADNPALDGLDDAALVRARAGDLLLWDSRTVHASAPACAAAPLPREADGTVRPSRAAAYVCMVPAEPHVRNNPHLARARALAAMHWITTTHWPQDNRAVSQGRQTPRDGLAHLSATARALVLGEPRTAAAAEAAAAAQAAAEAAAAEDGMAPAALGGGCAGQTEAVGPPAGIVCEDSENMTVDVSVFGRNASTETVDAESVGVNGSVMAGDLDSSSRLDLGLPPAADGAPFLGTPDRPMQVFTAPTFTPPTGVGAGFGAGDAAAGVGDAGGGGTAGFAAESTLESEAPCVNSSVNSGVNNVSEDGPGGLSDGGDGSSGSSRRMWRNGSACSVDMVDGAAADGGAAPTGPGSNGIGVGVAGSRRVGAAAEAGDTCDTEGGNECDAELGLAAEMTD
jgi:hypothetical protein